MRASARYPDPERVSAMGLSAIVYSVWFIVFSCSVFCGFVLVTFSFLLLFGRCSFLLLYRLCLFACFSTYISGYRPAIVRSYYRTGLF